jgi:hypothetical protein
MANGVLGTRNRADLASTLRWARSASDDELVAQRRRLTNAVFSGAYLEPIPYAKNGLEDQGAIFSD